MRERDVRKQEAVASLESDGEIAVLRGCLVDGDAVQRARSRRDQRRALILSVLTQVAVVAGILLVPLVWATEKLALAAQPAIPIIAGGSRQPSAHPRPSTHGHFVRSCTFCPPRATDRTPVIRDGDPEPEGGEPGLPTGGCPGCPVIPGAEAFSPDSSRAVVPRPSATKPEHLKPGRITTVEPARLVYRVEPVYPPLAKIARRSGRVVLHAIIAVDGTIQSLQVTGGDPLFFASALEAVRQWRYQPTFLNSQPVEVETTITVIYRAE